MILAAAAQETPDGQDGITLAPRILTRTAPYTPPAPAPNLPPPRAPIIRTEPYTPPTDPLVMSSGSGSSSGGGSGSSGGGASIGFGYTPPAVAVQHASAPATLNAEPQTLPTVTTFAAKLPSHWQLVAAIALVVVGLVWWWRRGR